MPRHLVPLLLALWATITLWTNPAVASCGIIGDSISVGVAQQLPGCFRDAEVGVPSVYAPVARAYAKRSGKSGRDVLDRARASGPRAPDYLAVSVGSNDPVNPALAANLTAIRFYAGAGGSRVVWVVPRHPRAATLVRAEAARNGDRTVEFAAGPDGVHPRSYGALAAAVLAEFRTAPPLPPPRP